MDRPRSFTVGLVQMRCSPDAGENLAKALAYVDRAAGGGAQVICLPGLSRTPYFCQRGDVACFDLAETIPGETTEALARIARERGVVVVGSVFERRAAGIFHNTAVIFDADGSLRGRYRKMHIPDDPLYYEKFYFTPRDLGFHAFPTRFVNVGPLVCCDQWFPEGARLTAPASAGLRAYPAPIGWRPSPKAGLRAAQTSPSQT